MILQHAWRYLFTPKGGEYVEMKPVRHGSSAPVLAEGWWLTCRSVTERQHRVFSVLSAYPAVNVGTFVKE
ncbi:MAG TPA: hypothetical protein VLK82_01845 [Candidatus Tectomicrobia bacterium]|nr:hypothetical protein [Candidatus Tectomicrobia bacterium]